MRGENGSTGLTFAPTPYLIISFLPPAIRDVSFATTIYANHINMLA